MKCGHCGSEIEDGYTVCKSCGANLRNRPKRVLIGFIICLFSVPLVIDTATRLSEPHAPELLGASVIWLLIGVFVIRSGMKKQWFRYNA